MDTESRSLGDFLSTEVSNFGVFLILSGEVDCRLLPTCKLPLIPQAGYMVVYPIRTGELARGGITAIQVLHGVLPSLTVWLTFLGVQLTHALLRAASVITSFVVGVASV